MCKYFSGLFHALLYVLFSDFHVAYVRKHTACTNRSTNMHSRHLYSSIKTIKTLANLKTFFINSPPTPKIILKIVDDRVIISKEN